MYKIGVDVGSTFTKYCILDIHDGNVERKDLFTERTPVCQREYFRKRTDYFCRLYEGCFIVTCGYGRKNVENQRTITELTALAAGADYQCPDINVILDIGGQDTKIVYQENGKLKNFFVNEKCAAGCGLFLGHILQLLQMDFKDIDLSDYCESDIHLSSVCAIFAQSEVVELIAEGVSGMAIVHAVLKQIMTQAKTLLTKVNCERIALSGGLTQIPGIRELAEKILRKQVMIPEDAVYLSAIGCALQERK